MTFALASRLRRIGSGASCPSRRLEAALRPEPRAETRSAARRCLPWLRARARRRGLAAAEDRALWECAKAGGFAILSKDADFRQLSFLYGTPPKVIWLRVGNRSTAEIEVIVRAHASDFEAFDVDPGASMLVVTA
jgi:predicted nuclease of predicted toxin-antitoxin system